MTQPPRLCYSGRGYDAGYTAEGVCATLFPKLFEDAGADFSKVMEYAMRFPNLMYIDGAWASASDGATLDIIDPATEE